MLFYKGSCVQLWACTPAHEQTQTDKKQFRKLPQRALFTGLLNIEVCLSVCLSVRFAFGVRRVHRTDSDALGTDRRPLFMLKVSYCSSRKRCRDRRARPCIANSYQWQLSLGFYTQPPRSLSSSEQHHHTHQRPPRPTITTTTTTPPLLPSHHQLYRSFPGLMVRVAAAGGDGDDRSWWWWLQQVGGDGDDRS